MLDNRAVAGLDEQVEEMLVLRELLAECAQHDIVLDLLPVGALPSHNLVVACNGERLARRLGLADVLFKRRVNELLRLEVVLARGIDLL